MDSTIREEELQKYVLVTLRYIRTVKDFCDRKQEWILQRETEVKMMRDIKSRSEKFSGNFKKQALKRELEVVLRDTLEGLGVLQLFLDAVEELAVTSLFVFMDESILMQKVDTVEVRTFISTAKTMSPLLILFKRDAGHFFLPSMANVDVHAFYLEKYISITQLLCERISENMLDVIGVQSQPPSRFSWFRHWRIKASIEQLSKIRMDKCFRLMFLFNGRAQDFIETYSGCRSEMFQFLSDFEGTAVQLDKMKKGSSISTVAGSSVGITGGVLSIVGLALAPVTAGVSLALTLTGVGLGVTSGLNSLVTGITEMAVNRHHGKKAKNIFQKFMEHVQTVQGCLEQGSNQCLKLSVNYGNIVPVAGKVISGAGTVGKGIDAIVDGTSAVKALQSEEVAMAAVNMGLQDAKAAQSIPNLASDLPDIGQLAKGTPLALSKSARAGFITLNALFIGLDVLFICKESVSLAKGEKSEISQAIRSRSALWHTEIEAWDKMYDCLCEGKATFQKNLEILNQSFTVLEMIKSKMQKWMKCIKRIACNVINYLNLNALIENMS
ncbi:uncharacterized protein [Hoplias malabaricus]|uniref:uncharacterized protein n=1 Tax=Hoplias malabaricus TaxID=27720 RepID=UPI003462F995